MTDGIDSNRLDGNFVVASINSSKAVILASKYAVERGIRLQSEIFSKFPSDCCEFDLCLLICSQQDFESSSNDKRNNLSVFSFRKSSTDDSVGEDDVAKVISDLCPKAFLVVDSSADSQNRLNSVSGACLDCNLFFSNDYDVDSLSSHVSQCHADFETEILERRRQNERFNDQVPFAAFFTPQQQQPQLVEALPWQSFSVVLPNSGQEDSRQTASSNSNEEEVSTKTSPPPPSSPPKPIQHSKPQTSSLNLVPPVSTTPSRAFPTPSPLTSSAGTTRCVSKTLKCPRCNWHYKYQETLEIHMREKHPDADTSQCIYCATKREHPRLSRGENYSCGYKPYRCEICNYATTTKGNLSIHMQSDKHLHNVQEFAASQGADTRPAPSAAAIEASTLAAAAASFQQQQQRQMTSSGTSQKIAASSSQSVKPTKSTANYQRSLPHQKPVKPEKTADVLANLASTSNQNASSSAAATLASLAASQSQSKSSGLSTSLPFLEDFSGLESLVQQYAMCRDLIMNNEFQQQTGVDASTANLLLQQLATTALTSSPNVLNSLFMPNSEANTSAKSTKAPATSLSSLPHSQNSNTAKASTSASNLNGKLYECLLCDNFATDSLAELKAHMDYDRTLNPPIHDFDTRILAMVDNYYFCKLCTYKTPLKANFQVHSKTEKHLQKFQMLLHILEGGSKTESKLASFPNVTSSVRCAACDFPAASAHRLDQHALSIGHELFCKLANDVIQLGTDAKFNYVCRLCSSAGNADNTFASKTQLSRHLASPEHMRQETFLQAQRSTLDTNGLSQSGEIDLRQLIEIEPYSGNRTLPSPADSSQVSSAPDVADNSSPSSMPSRLGSTLAIHNVNSTSKLACPICQTTFDSHIVCVQHLTDVHSVPQANVPRLLELMALIDGPHPSAENANVTALPNADKSATGNKRPLSTSREQSDDNRQTTTSPIDLSVPKRPKMSSSSNNPVSIKEESKPASSLSLSNATADALTALTSQLSYDQMFQSLFTSSFTQSLLPGTSASAAIGQLAANVAAQQQQQQMASSTVASSNEEQFRCHSCTKLFPTVENLFNHLAESQHLNNNTATVKGPGLLCWKKGCNQYFKSVHTLKMHFRQIHNIGLPDFILDPSKSSNAHSSTPKLSTGEQKSKAPQQFKCSHCSLTFESSSALESHSKLHLANLAGFSCAVCGAKQESFSDYTEHLNTHRANIQSSESSSKTNSFKCDPCNASFADIDLYRGHCHSVAHKINSTENGKIAKTKSEDSATLTGVYGATPSGPYKCDICEISFARQTYLQQHLLSPFHQKSVQRLQNSLMDRGRMSILDTLQQAALLQQQPVQSQNLGLGGFDLTAAALNPLLTNQILSSLGASLPSTPADVWASALAQQPGSGNIQNLIQQQAANLVRGKKVTPPTPAVSNGPISTSTPIASNNSAATSQERKPKCSARILKMLENVGSDVVKSRLVSLTVPNANLNASTSNADDNKDACNASTSSASSNCSTCSTLQDLDDPMPLKEHRESEHGLAITAQDVEKVIEKMPDVFGQKVGDEFRGGPPEKSPVKTEKEQPKVEPLPQQPSQPPPPPQQPALNLMGNMDPLLSICAAAGLLDPSLLTSGVKSGEEKLISPSPAPTGESGRTRITDEQRAVFREYFNINNLPSENEIDDICRRTNLSRKVVKHWFRNTLFKERQRSQHSPYNLNIPPSSEKVDVDVKVECDKEDKLNMSSQVSDANDEYDEVDEMSRSSSPNDGTSRNSWRRASRTKFSDFQLQSLLDAFERNPYPREEDQKRLSQHLGLNQRVITVWFQNQRQKTRRSSHSGSGLANGENIKMPGNQDMEQDAMSEAMSSDESGVDEPVNSSNLAIPSGSNSGGSAKRVRTSISSAQHDLMYDVFQRCQNPTRDQLESLSAETGLSRRTIQVWFQNQRSRERKSNRPDLAALLSVENSRTFTGNEDSVASSLGSQNDDDSNSSFNTSNNNNNNNGSSLTPSNSSSNAKRRYRTQLSQTQIKVMRSIFDVYKTPTQAECIQLANEIGLQKSVVQVWFQNARAKEKKAKLGFITGSNSPTSVVHDEICTECHFQGVTGASLPEHLFSTRHIDALKVKFENSSSNLALGSSHNNGDLSSEEPEKPKHSPSSSQSSESPNHQRVATSATGDLAGVQNLSHHALLASQQ